MDEDLIALATQSATVPTVQAGLDEDLAKLANNTARIQAEKERRRRLDAARDAAAEKEVISNPLVGAARGFKNIYGGVRQVLPESLGGFSEEQEAAFEKERLEYESTPRRLGVDVAEVLVPGAALGGVGAGVAKYGAQHLPKLFRVPALPGSIAAGGAVGGSSYIPPGSDVSRLAMATTGAGLGPLGLLGGRMLERTGRGVFAPRDMRSYYNISGETPLQGDAEALFRRGIGQGASPEAAFGAAQGATLPSRYPLTRGQSTGDTDLLRWEHEARNGVHGPVAEARVKQMDAQQAASGQANRDAIRQQAGGRTGPYVRGESMDRLEETLKTASDDLRTEIRSAYIEAKEAGRSYAPSAGLKVYRENLRKELISEGFDVSEPKLQSALKPLDKLLKLKGFKAAEVNSIEVLRKRLNNVYGSTKVSDPSVAASAQIAIRKLDETMDAMLEAGLINGDRNMLDLYRNARALNTRHARLYSDDKVIEKLTSDALSPEQKANVLFGSARLSSRGDAKRAIVKLKEEFGEDSPVIKDIKDEAVMRLFYNQPTDGFSAQKFVTEFDEVITKGKGRTIMNELFTRDEMNMIQQLRNVAKRSVIDPTTFNPSRSSYGMANILNRLIPGIGGIAGAVPWVGQIARDFRNAARAAAIESQIPLRSGGGIPYGAAAGTAADDLMEEQ